MTVRVARHPRTRQIDRSGWWRKRDRAIRASSTHLSTALRGAFDCSQGNDHLRRRSGEYELKQRVSGGDYGPGFVTVASAPLAVRLGSFPTYRSSDRKPI